MHRYRLVAVITIVILLISSTLAYSAPARTTPTTIDPSGNTVKVDSTANTVKIDSAANIVKIDSAINTVKIDSNNNTVQSPTKHATIQLWAGDQVIANGSSATAYFNCAGYKELRLMLGSSLFSFNSNLIVYITLLRPDGSGYYSIATANFGTPTHVFSDQGNLAAVQGRLSFTMPVLADTMGVYIQNNTGSSVTISNWSNAYLVN